MKILVLSTDYPRPDGYVSQFFIHTRNIEYAKSGIDVTVMSFTATKNYVIDGVTVITQESLLQRMKEEVFDILISHAPNLRNHYRFLIKHGDNFRKIIYFFHGHEVLRSSKVYPEPYEYLKRASILHKTISEIYDVIKLAIWKRFFIKHLEKSEFVFVSRWMYDRFIEFVKLNPRTISNKSHIIFNSIGTKFESETYKQDFVKHYDFITIRNMLDKSKYGIDIVLRMAKNNPSYKFCVIGKGDFFKFNKKPNNIEFISKHLTHDEVIHYLNQSKYAFMPTRADAQGVMACEMATFGIPLITSDIDVCKEIFSGFKNVLLIDNNKDYKIQELNLAQLKIPEAKNKKFFSENTIGAEIELFSRLLEE